MIELQMVDGPDGTCFVCFSDSDEEKQAFLDANASHRATYEDKRPLHVLFVNEPLINKPHAELLRMCGVEPEEEKEVPVWEKPLHLLE